MMRWITVLISVSAYLLLMGYSRSVLACQCGPQITVLQAFDNSDLIIITKAVSVEKSDIRIAHNFPYVNGVKSTKMIVEKVYKGDAKSGDELIFDQGGPGDCVFTFDEKDVGNKYLFYLSNKLKNSQSRYIPIFCGRSTEVGRAVDDLLYLDNLDKVRGRTRISGRLSNFSTGFAGIKITIAGKNRKWVINTNKDGVYEIYDLPPGNYLIEPDIPPGWQLDNLWSQLSASFSGDRDANIKSPMKRIPIRLEKGRHAGLDIIFEEKQTHDSIQ